MYVLTYEWDNGYHCSCCRKHESRYEEFDTLEELLAMLLICMFFIAVFGALKGVSL